MWLANSLGRAARRVFSSETRASLRRSAVVNRLLRWTCGGVRKRPHPRSEFTLHFDGYRNLGWTLGRLADLESAEFEFAAAQLHRRAAKCVWDVGANVGLWSLFFASRQFGLEHVVAYEPDSFNRGLLELNRDQNAIRQLQVRDVALSDHSGTATFFADSVTGSTGSLEKEGAFTTQWYGSKPPEITVPLSTVDEEIASGKAPAPQFMKIDVEGHELDLLRGAERTLAEHRPTIIMEVSRHQEEVGALLRRHGYRMVDPGTGADLDLPAFATGAIPSEMPASPRTTTP